MERSSWFGRTWRRLMLRGATYGSAHGRLRLLYLLRDPWGMETPREGARFLRTLEILQRVRPRYDSILECGCGEGHQTAYLRRLTHRLTAVDISPVAIERARLRCPDVHFQVLAIEELNKTLYQKHFQMVVACEVLYYVRDPVSVITQLQSLGDYLFVTNFSERSGPMKDVFAAKGWCRLEDIVVNGVRWECHLWDRRLAETQPGEPSVRSSQ
jgi:SAM-dependent methyltransferase